MQHTEFFHHLHFECDYHRIYAGKPLSDFIEFFWETRFDELYKKYPRGFSDALFPNVGYTYLINLGTPFVMQLGVEHFKMRTDGFLPRNKSMICHHAAGNKIFGIKFRVSPVILEKPVNFSEYRGYIFPLAHLIDRNVVKKIKAAKCFNERLQIAAAHYNNVIQHYNGSVKQVQVVTQIFKTCLEEKQYNPPMQKLAEKYRISTRTLQRYFEATTGMTGKEALQILRIRKALEHLINNTGTFHYSHYGYFDHSHFYKHLQRFLQPHALHPTTTAWLRHHAPAM